MSSPGHIILGDRYALHPGLHGALRVSPPEAISYEVREGVHTLLVPEDAPSVFDAQASLEAVDFGEGSEPVHSSLWPVLNRRAWVVDMDDLFYVVLCGQYALNPEFRTREVRKDTRTARFASQLARRIRCMCAALAHATCKAVLVHTRYELQRTMQFVERVMEAEHRDALLGKLTQVHCVAPPCPPARVDDKWHHTGPIRIVFCGRDFERKRGLWALRAFERLLDEGRDVQCCYIGNIPPEVQASHQHVLSRMDFSPSVNRARVLDVLAQSHVLFHPSEGESVGAALLEAMAAGMCIVTASGAGMEHLTEWFDDGGAELVHRTSMPMDGEEDAFHRALTRVIENRELASTQGRNNYEKLLRGRLSIARRDRVLQQVYERCFDDTADEPLRVDDLRSDDERVWRLSSEELIRARQQYRSTVNFTAFSLDVQLEL
jgi:glycosyltransferase involved in cell wall biosynthesis